jgi:O-antigen/teichoic acid export membrane protein
MYWGLAFVVGLITVAGSGFIAEHWLSGSELSVGEIQRAVVLMGAVLVLQWPLGLYSGGLMGVQRQVALNTTIVAMMTLRHVGTFLVLWLVSPTITAFFLCQLVASGLHTLVTRWVLWRSLPSVPEGSRVRLELLSTVWRFATGLSATSLLVVVLTQMDKVVLSSTLSLTTFGYYTLATLIAGSLLYLCLPVFQAVFPRFSQLVVTGDERALSRLYHQACQLISVLVIPVAAVIAMFSREIVQVWTGSAATADKTAILASLLITGNALNALMNVPYALQLAYGWTRLVFYLNLGAVLIFAPILFVVTRSYGAVGAASVWVAINAFYVGIGIPLMHRRLLGGERRRWYLEDVAAPLAAAVAVTGLARLIFPHDTPALVTVLLLALVLLSALAASAVATPATRAWRRQAMSWRPADFRRSRPRPGGTR